MALLLLGKTYWMAADATAVSGIITRRGEEMDQVRALFSFLLFILFHFFDCLFFSPFVRASFFVSRKSKCEEH
jgi:hypothetical protein